MSLLREILKINETAAGGVSGAAGVTGSHDVGGYHGSLFKGGVFSRNGKKGRKMTGAHRMPTESLQKTIKNRNAWKWRIIGEMVDDSTFDASDVVSKLDAAEKKARQDEDTIPFGMEDEDGNIVKVYVRAEQADECKT